MRQPRGDGLKRKRRKVKAAHAAMPTADRTPEFYEYVPSAAKGKPKPR